MRFGPLSLTANYKVIWFSKLLAKVGQLLIWRSLFFLTRRRWFDARQSAGERMEPMM